MGEYFKWTRPQVNEKVLEILKRSATKVDSVALESNLDSQLLLSKNDIFAFQWDLQEIFQFDHPNIPPMKNGVEAAEYVTNVLQESGRLI